MEKAFKGLQSENYSLRDYVLTLQGRLLESTGDFPQPPPNVNINQSNPQQPPEHGIPETQAERPQEQPPPPPPPPQQQHQHEQPQAKWGASPLEAVARAVADLAAEGEHHQGDQEHADTEMKDEPGSSRPEEGHQQQSGTQA